MRYAALPVLLMALLLAGSSTAGKPIPTCTYNDGQLLFVDFPNYDLRLLIIDAETQTVEQELDVLVHRDTPMTVDFPTDPTIYRFFSRTSGKFVAECSGH